MQTSPLSTTKHSIQAMGNSDLDGVLATLTAAFGDEDGPKLCLLTWELLSSDSANPALCLVAKSEQKVLGHALFTHARIENSKTPCKASILSPMAICPDYQNQGLGKQLMEEGCRMLAKEEVKLLFIFGSPDYYHRFGFIPADQHGLKPPHPVPGQYADAWMVKELQDGTLGNVTGTVNCGEPLNDPTHWTEGLPR